MHWTHLTRQQAFTYFAVIALALATIEITFAVIARYQARTVSLSIAGVLQRESALANPYLVSQTLNDLENLELAKCLVLHEEGSFARPFLDLRFKSSCGSDSFLGKRFRMHSAIRAANGKAWELDYEIHPIPAFLLVLWIARILALLCGALSVGWHYAKLDQASLVHDLKLQHLSRTAETALQVSHDLRAPLASLQAAIGLSTGLSAETKELVSHAASRIRGICDDMLAQGRKPTESRSTSTEHTGRSEALAPLLEAIIAEKRVLHSSLPRLSISLSLSNSEQTFIAVDPTLLGRVLSNLIGNGVEAVSESGAVHVFCETTEEEKLKIHIQDTGTGMSEEVMAKLGIRGFTSGKEKGAGLGVHHAFEAAAQWGGKLSYVSTPGLGTTASITIPTVPIPPIYVTKLLLPPDLPVVVLDDDLQIHQSWETRLRKLDWYVGGVRCFARSEDLLAWFRSEEGHLDALLICDHYLANDRHTGIDVIQMLGASFNSVLSTHLWPDPSLRTRCEKLRISILPKPWMENLTITNAKHHEGRI